MTASSENHSASVPDIILLNGSSGAGKSSLAIGLQERLKRPYLIIGIDDFLRLLPPRWIGTPEGFQFRPQSDGTVPAHFGPGGRLMLQGFHRSAAALVDSGLGIIVDDVILDEETLNDWLLTLHGKSVFFVGIDCELDELERREASRPDRAKGHVRAHYADIHSHGDYDARVDTTATDTATCAEKVMAALAAWDGQTAFSRLSRLLVDRT